MGSIHEVMEVFREAPSNSERGTKFEKLMVRYFDLYPLLSQQYDGVWRWIDWPGRKGKPDTGIDLVARERDSGEYTAIQRQSPPCVRTVPRDAGRQVGWSRKHLVNAPCGGRALAEAMTLDSNHQMVPTS